MTDVKLFKQAFEDSGVTITFLAEKMGCSRNRIYAILAGGECAASEIMKLTELLHLSTSQRDAIFFAQNSE